MSRLVKLPTKELGEVQILAIWETDPLRETPVGGLFSSTKQEVFTLALSGWTRPLALALGLPPVGALRKLPRVSMECDMRRGCPVFDKKRCFPTAKDMPWCFEPEGFSDNPTRVAAAKAIGHWREGVYLVVITEDND
jgi:hypothetical protein